MSILYIANFIPRTVFWYNVSWYAKENYRIGYPCDKWLKTFTANFELSQLMHFPPPPDPLKYYNNLLFSGLIF